MSINAKERVVMAVRGPHSISPTGLSYYLQHKGKVFQIVILLVFLLWQLQGTSEMSLLWGGIRELAWMIVDKGRGGEGRERPVTLVNLVKRTIVYSTCIYCKLVYENI